MRPLPRQPSFPIFGWVAPANWGPSFLSHWEKGSDRDAGIAYVSISNMLIPDVFDPYVTVTTMLLSGQWGADVLASTTLTQFPYPEIRSAGLSVPALMEAARDKEEPWQPSTIRLVADRGTTSLEAVHFGLGRAQAWVHVGGRFGIGVCATGEHQDSPKITELAAGAFLTTDQRV